MMMMMMMMMIDDATPDDYYHGAPRILLSIDKETQIKKQRKTTFKSFSEVVIMYKIFDCHGNMFAILIEV